MERKNWSIYYKHTFAFDTFEGTYEQAVDFAIQTIKQDLEEDGIILPITVHNCGTVEICNNYVDLIEEIAESLFDDEDED